MTIDGQVRKLMGSVQRTMPAMIRVNARDAPTSVSSMVGMGIGNAGRCRTSHDPNTCSTKSATRRGRSWSARRYQVTGVARPGTMRARTWGP